VVADEVRNLALRTQRSTEEIESLVAGVQSGTQAVASGMESSLLLSESSVECTHRAVSALENITSKVSIIQAMNQQIANGGGTAKRRHRGDQSQRDQRSRHLRPDGQHLRGNRPRRVTNWRGWDMSWNGWWSVSRSRCGGLGFVQRPSLPFLIVCQERARLRLCPLSPSPKKQRAKQG